MSAEVIVAGLLTGALYGLLALGQSLVFGVMRLVNLAYGDFAIAAAFLALFIVDHTGAGPLAALPLVVVVVAAVAYPVERLLLSNLVTVNPQAPLVATFGLSLIIQAGLQAGFGTDPRSLDASFSSAGLTILGVRVQVVYLVAAALAAVVTALAHWVLTRTRAGASVRAAAADPATAGMLGINVGRVYGLTFAVGAGIAAVGGVMVGIAQGFTPTSGLPILLVGFAVIALGGIGNVRGAFLGGVTLGLLQSVAVEIFGAGYRNLAVYLIFFLVLALAPNGLFSGRRSTA